MIIQAEAKNMVLVADARGKKEAGAIAEILCVQRLVEEKILCARRPLFGEGVFESCAENVFRSRRLRPGGAQNAARIERQRPRPARAARSDAAREIEKRAVKGDAGAATNAREKIGA